MKFPNWAEFVLISGDNKVLGQGNTMAECVRMAMGAGYTTKQINAATVHQTVAQPVVSVKIKFINQVW